jgi:hypothetical protein
MKPLSRIAALAALSFAFAGCSNNATPASGLTSPAAASLRAPHFYVEDVTLHNKTPVTVRASFSNANCAGGFPDSLKIDASGKWDGHINTVTGRQCTTGGGYAKFNVRLIKVGDEGKGDLILLFAVNRTGNWTIAFASDTTAQLCVTGNIENLDIHEKKNAPGGCFS